MPEATVKLPSGASIVGKLNDTAWPSWAEPTNTKSSRTDRMADRIVTSWCEQNTTASVRQGSHSFLRPRRHVRSGCPICLRPHVHSRLEALQTHAVHGHESRFMFARGR